MQAAHLLCVLTHQQPAAGHLGPRSSPTRPGSGTPRFNAGGPAQRGWHADARGREAAPGSTASTVPTAEQGQTRACRLPQRAAPATRPAPHFLRREDSDNSGQRSLGWARPVHGLRSSRRGTGLGCRLDPSLMLTGGTDGGSSLTSMFSLSHSPLTLKQ